MSPIVAEGLVLAAYGMGTVFVFLTMLVLATMLMSRIAGPDTEEPEDSVDMGIESTKIAAITAAVHEHRRRS